ncbi:MAG TPA: GntR family transcriptional regulator [Candidatus Obscuribacterales bacterium]
MKITINKESSIPIRDQLIEQIALQIASGSLKGKEKLPSIRALAQRLGIHYSTVTAAYNHLAGVGLLDIRQGSGVRVAGPAQSDLPFKGTDLQTLCADFLALAGERGFKRSDVRDQLDSLLNCEPVKRILCVDRNKDFHPILASELSPHFSIPTIPLTIDELMQKKEQLKDSLVVTSLYHLFAFQDIVQDRTRLVVCDIEPGRAELEHIQDLPDGSLVLLVSMSQTLLNMATKLLAARRGEQIAVRSVLTDDREELKYMMKYATVVLCDSPSEATVAPLVGKTRMMAFRLYSPSTIDRIRDRLEKWG